ncbi:MAG TPA: DUF255 domain-containing protein, partial [Candidatus Binatia bacterium]|nr:DUF255 domain-containing protein [Candidatus Binatia bacterium]
MLRFSPNPNLAHLIRWFVWEEDAFKAAREQDKPVMLFLSAFWCRYCQRMDEGALSERENMAVLNAYFIALRAENATRPDIDARYNLNGWPTIAFFTPAGELLAACNYLGADEFKDLLLSVYMSYQQKSPEERKTATTAPESVADNRKRPAADVLEEITRAIIAQADQVYGGYGRGQKFIQPAVNEFLLARYEATQDNVCLEHVCRTLERMRQGQIYDTEEGGYFRTTTGADWSQPHREKLLGEHAGLLSNCMHLLRLTGRTEYARMAEEIIDYLDRKLFDARRGVFFGCEDFLRRESQESSGSEFFTIIDECAYSDSNAQAVCAYLEAAATLGRPDCRERALRILEFLWNACRDPARGMFHYHDGAPHLAGWLEDQTQVGIALLQAHLALGDGEYLDHAREMADLIVRRCKNPQGGYFDLTDCGMDLRRVRLTDADQNGAASS